MQVKLSCKKKYVKNNKQRIIFAINIVFFLRVFFCFSPARGAAISVDASAPPGDPRIRATPPNPPLLAELCPVHAKKKSQEINLNKQILFFILYKNSIVILSIFVIFFVCPTMRKTKNILCQSCVYIFSKNKIKKLFVRVLFTWNKLNSLMFRNL